MKIEFDRKDDKLIVSTAEFMGKKYLDVRSFYFKNGEFNPGKGVTLKKTEEIDFVLKAITENRKEIEEWIKPKS